MLTAVQLGITDEELMAMVAATTERKPPRVRCSVCRHEHVAVIDGLLALGVSARDVAASYDLSRSAVDRHLHRHLPRFPAAGEARAVLAAGELIPPIIEKLRSADRFGLAKARPVFDALWDALHDTLDDSAHDRLLRSLAEACVWLCRPQGYDDVRGAIHALRAWRDTGGL